jgi:hypothetical protein
VGFFDQQRRDEKQRGCEKPQAPCNVRLACVGGDHLGIAHLPDVPIGAKDSAGLGLLGRLHRCVGCLGVALDVPRAGLEGRARGGTAFARVALVFRQMRGLNTVLRPARGHRCEGLVSRVRSAQALGVPVHAVYCDGLGCAPCGFLPRGLSTFHSRLCIHHPPTLGHPIGAQGQWLLAGVGSKGRPGIVREGRANDLRNPLQGGGPTSAKAQLCQMDGMGLTGECGSGDEIT